MPLSAGMPLWDKIEAGMPFEQARSLYPEGHVNTGKGLFRPMITIERVVDGCQMSIWILIDRKVAEPEAKVESVRLSGQKCDAKMFANLMARYGQPQSNNDDNRKQKEKKAIWVAEGKTITFQVRYGSPDFWELTYAPIRDLGL